MVTGNELDFHRELMVVSTFICLRKDFTGISIMSRWCYFAYLKQIFNCLLTLFHLTVLKNLWFWGLPSSNTILHLHKV